MEEGPYFGGAIDLLASCAKDAWKSKVGLRNSVSTAGHRIQHNFCVLIVSPCNVFCCSGVVVLAIQKIFGFARRSVIPRSAGEMFSAGDGRQYIATVTEAE